jgi:hypothetical protein
VRLDIHGEAFVPILVVDLLFNVGESGHARPAGVRYYDVQAPHGVDCFFDQILHGGLGGHVRLDEVKARVGLRGAPLDGGELFHEGVGAFGVRGVVYYLQDVNKGLSVL